MFNARRIFLFLTVSILIQPAFAAKIYKRIPFTTSINGVDTVIVNYDFTGKRGIYCTASANTFTMEFVYKGYIKTAKVPVLIQHAHVPDKETERLADISGRFSLFVGNNNTEQEYKVSCHYANSDN